MVIAVTLGSISGEAAGPAQQCPLSGEAGAVGARHGASSPTSSGVVSRGAVPRSSSQANPTVEASWIYPVSGRVSYLEMAGTAPAGAFANPPLLPGWPQQMPAFQFIPNDNPTLYDFDGDGKLEVLSGTTGGGGSVYIWRFDGTLFPGWPQACGPYCQSGPAIGDIDGDGNPEIVAFGRGLTDNGFVYAWRTDGAACPGYPRRLDGFNPSGSPSLRDLDGDGAAEILVGTNLFPQGRLYVLKGDGSVAKGFPVTLDNVATGTVATGDIDGDGRIELVLATFHSIYAISTDGSVMSGWPFTPGGEYRISFSSPALADLDGDGDLEIAEPGGLLGSGHGRMYVLHHTGAVATGWPRTLQHVNAQGASPAIGDVDGDGKLEIVLGDVNWDAGDWVATLYCWRFDASAVSGWPVVVPWTWQIRGTPLLADLDGDGRVEITATSAVTRSGISQFHGYNDDGTVMAGWPLEVTGYSADNAPAIGDIDGDGNAELVVVSTSFPTAIVYVWALGIPSAPALAYWPMHHHDVLHTGQYGLSFEPPVITATCPLPGGVVGLTYARALAATGGAPPFAWSVESGQLPIGLTLDPVKGLVAGTPATAGTSTFTARVTDSLRHGSSLACSITVLPALVITTRSLPDGQVGVVYAVQLEATGGTTPITWSITAGALPQGLSLSPDGRISGTPGYAGTATFTVRAADAGGQTAFAPLTILVAEATPVPLTGVPGLGALAILVAIIGGIVLRNGRN